MSTEHSSRPEPQSEQRGNLWAGLCRTWYPWTGCWRSSSPCRRRREVEWAALHHRVFWQTPQVWKQGWKSSANRQVCEIPPASSLLQVGNTARTVLTLIICAFSPYLGQQPKIQRPAHKLPESLVTLREVQPKFSSKNMGMISGGVIILYEQSSPSYGHTLPCCISFIFVQLHSLEGNYSCLIWE